MDGEEEGEGPYLQGIGMQHQDAVVAAMASYQALLVPHTQKALVNRGKEMMRRRGWVGGVRRGGWMSSEGGQGGGVDEQVGEVR